MEGKSEKSKINQSCLSQYDFLLNFNFDLDLNLISSLQNPQSQKATHNSEKAIKTHGMNARAKDYSLIRLYWPI